MSDEKPLYKITRGNEYITITTGYRGIDIDPDNGYNSTRLWNVFSGLLKESQDSGEVPTSCGGQVPDKLLADYFLEWIRKKHPEVGEFQAEYIGEDISWWENGFPSVALPEEVKVTDDGHWIDKNTGEDLDDLKGEHGEIYIDY